MLSITRTIFYHGNQIEIAQNQQNKIQKGTTKSLKCDLFVTIIILENYAQN